MDRNESLKPLEELVAQLRPALDEAGEARPGDETLVDTMVGKAAAAATAPAVGLPLLAKLALVGGAGGALVVVALAMRPQQAPPERPKAPVAIEAKAAAPTPTPAPSPEPAPAPAPVAEPEPDPPAKQEGAPEAAPPSASELLQLANAARRDGELRTAMAQYRRLLRLYPKSREAATALIARGRLQAGPLGRPADGIRSFEAYLSRYGDGSLAPEAAAGIARGYKALGDKKRERKAWQELLRRFPGSVYASEARRRLAAVN